MLLHLPTNPYQNDFGPFHFVLLPDQKLDLKDDITTRNKWMEIVQNNSTIVTGKLSKSKTISEIWLSETSTTIKRTNFFYYLPPSLILNKVQNIRLSILLAAH